MKSLKLGIDAVPYRVIESQWKKLHNIRGFFDKRKPLLLISRFPTTSEYAVAPSFGLTSTSYQAEKTFSRKTQRTIFYSRLLYTTRRMHGLAYSRSVPDYNIISYGLTYNFPNTVIDRDIRSIKKEISNNKKRTSIYLSSSDALCHKFGDAAIKDLLRRVDQEIFPDIDPKCDVTFYSDHGMSIPRKKGLKNIYVEKILEENGFRIRSSSLKRKNDILTIRSGLLSFSQLYCHRSADDRMKRRITRLISDESAVELAACRLSDRSIIVSNRQGMVRITKEGDRFSCESLEGKPILGKLEGSYTASELLASSADHNFPDAVHRLHDAFHGVKDHADILVSLKDGYVSGSALINLAYNRLGKYISTHGSISKDCTSTFAISRDKDATDPYCVEKNRKRYMRINDLKLRH
ncbi:alkaline phosphatase family protein [Candidatus Woesearchaeota archaeon]|nr:alkaline phosphatase family protein [Candidatus Woesearchaeota archaeon]